MPDKKATREPSGGHATVMRTLKSAAADAAAQGRVWAVEKFRRLVVGLVFVGVAVAVSAAIPPSAYSATVWLSTILGRIVPVCVLLMLCFLPQSDVGTHWPRIMSCV